jgi:hypothetical protein
MGCVEWKEVEVQASGFGVIVYTYKVLEEGGRLRIISVRPSDESGNL